MYTDYDNIKAYDKWCCNAACGCSDCRELEEEERDLSTHGFYIDSDLEVARIDGGLGAIYDAETDETVGWYRLNWNRYDKKVDAVVTVCGVPGGEYLTRWQRRIEEAVKEQFPAARVRYWL